MQLWSAPFPMPTTIKRPDASKDGYPVMVGLADAYAVPASRAGAWERYLRSCAAMCHEWLRICYTRHVCPTVRP